MARRQQSVLAETYPLGPRSFPLSVVPAESDRTLEARALVRSLEVGRILAGAGTEVVQLVIEQTEFGESEPLLLAGAALALWIGVIVVTLVLNAPVNAEAATWDPASPPLDWESQRDKWHLGQTVRTPLAVASFVCLVLASQWSRLWP